MEQHEKFLKGVKRIRTLMSIVFLIFVLIGGFLVYLIIDPTFKTLRFNPSKEILTTISNNDELDFDRIENGVHVRTGLVEGDGLMLVVNNCTNCHSAQLVTQNRMTKEGWVATIQWMQETQNLWDLGKNEESIVNYLAKYYAPTKKGRRKNLTDIEWYYLED